jgi:hypothetical protein
MPITAFHALAAWHFTRDLVTRRASSDRGEGVISAAIAVLIVAFIGAAMWVAFNSIWNDSEARIRANVEQIGAEN